MNILTIPVPLFRRMLLALAEDRRRDLFLRVGVRSSSDHEWLARDFSTEPFAASGAPSALPFLVSGVSAQTERLFVPTALPSNAAGQLSVGDGVWRGQLGGVVRLGEAIELLHRVSLVGGGMHAIQLQEFALSEEDLRLKRRYEFFEQARWSRTMGALGGKDIWQRLVGLRIGIVGCGRTGSLVASTLVRLGVHYLTLIDPDLVEFHNLGEMDAVTNDDVERPKAKALADRLYLQSQRYATTLVPIVAAITTAEARAAAKECDVLFCCADNDAARLATAVLATLYHKVLVDIGTGVFMATADNEAAQLPQPRTMGGDVRLVLPGDGCLLCAGNLTNYQQAVEDIVNHRTPTLRAMEWRQLRAGSLRTLNQIIAGLGVQLLQDLVAERIIATTWAQIECDAVGRFAVRYPQVQVTADCPLCEKAGMGAIAGV